MKTYDKNKFWFLRDIYEDGARKWIKKDPVEGDSYYNEERRWCKNYPFYRKCIITYKLIDDIWVEQEDPQKFKVNWSAKNK